MSASAQFKKGHKGGPGRPKGSKNKVSQSARAVIAEAAEYLGGTARLYDWVREDPQNERAFWSSIYPKLITPDKDNPVHVVGTVTIKLD